jgi:Toprim-like
LSGYELKNVGFTGFASGGSKALWLSHELPDDQRLVFCEAAVDALSHAVLFPDNHARYASIGGKPNPQQPELIRAAAARMPNGSEIIAAMDADGCWLESLSSFRSQAQERSSIFRKISNPPSSF